MRRWLTVLLALASLAWGADARAHGKSVSHSVVRVRGSTVDVWLKLSAIDVSALFAVRGPVDLAALAPRQLRVRRGVDQCQPIPERAERRADTSGFVVLTWALRCAHDGGSVAVSSEILSTEIPSHVHFTQIEVDGVATPRVLSAAAHTTWVEEPRAPPSFWSTVVRTVTLGARHVMGGWDHLVFVAALVLLTRRLKRLAVMLTGFTLGHALSLTGAATGVVTVDAGAVEAAIALSIVVVAAENVWRIESAPSPRLLIGTGLALGALAVASAWARPTTGFALGGLLIAAGCLMVATARDDSPGPRALMAGVFGVVHGLGFAGALSQSTFSEGQRVASLLGFNLGVELAQLGLATALVAALSLVARPRKEAWIVQLGSATAVALGSYWLMLRAFGGA